MIGKASLCPLGAHSRAELLCTSFVISARVGLLRSVHARVHWRGRGIPVGAQVATSG